MKCPYCHKNNMPMPPKTPRPFGLCPDCGRKSRAAIAEGRGGKTYVHYSATNLRAKPHDEVKHVHTIRLSERDKLDILAGRNSLTIRNGRVTLAV